MLVGVTMVRNEEDVVALSIRHHLRIGCERVLVADNASTDSTGSVLRRLACRDRRVMVTHEPGPFRQSEVVTALAQEAAGMGAEWVLPFDADEFWWIGRRQRLAGLLRRQRHAGALRAPVVNFVQRRDQKARGARALWGMTARATPVGTVDAAQGLVTSRRIAFVEIRYPPKILVRVAPGVVIGTGSHGVAGAPGPVVDCDDLAVLHAPLRTREALVAQVDHGRRVAAAVDDRSTAWHCRRWLALHEEQGSLDGEWAANSHLRGYLDVHGARHGVVPDGRLRAAVLAATAARWLPRRGARGPETPS